MYFDIGRPIEVDLSKIETVLQHANGVGVLLAMDSNARSASWHDSTTNARGRTLDEYLMSKRLHILNEEGLNTTFQNRHGVSNIDLTVISNPLLRKVAQWEISDQESSSDHNIIKYVIGQGDPSWERDEFQDVRYLFKKENREIFQKNLKHITKTTLDGLRNAESIEDLDTILCARIAEEEDIEKYIEELHVILQTTCDTKYKKPSTFKKTTVHKSVPWWTQELTILRKRTNALRRRHQKTRNNGVLRDRRKVQYLESKAQ
jgi:hypothetical protein